jgi:hypothetical protein
MPRRHVPGQTFQSGNYWVDVVFTTAGGDRRRRRDDDGAGRRIDRVGRDGPCSATATDTAGASPRSSLDGVNLGAEDTVSPYT